ncbi:flagellar assembly protein FliH [Undibacterium sp. Jales W-56]|uniref:flagellar assembly protein FliH n=1 Tax=Undibacterium sp. Jales W-56 TaxID=2897325 RepID=UPI0021D2B040|nr:flagellar assembly protein FliH [Undibacterium sp. Jales W-56]MCU6435388.1 flagellar assembly protein FliH [Undibacterium sp. Jales W-56]
MSNAISKGNLSPFQRWEMASFGDERPSQQAEKKITASLAEKISLEEISKLKETSHREGYANGYKEGYLAGLGEGKETAYAETKATIDTEVGQLKSLIESLSEQIHLTGKVVGSDLLGLALDLAERMLKTRIEVDPEIILPIVREAIDSLPSVQLPAQIFVHPVDAEILRTHAGDELSNAGWRIHADSHIERGGCKLETAQNMVDATIATRWHRLAEAVKKSNS